MADPMTAMMVFSTVLSAAGSVKEGNDAKAGADFQAAQLSQQAGQDRATSQRAAIEERRQASLANSRLQNLAGGGGLDPTIVGLSADIAGEGEVRALSAIYEGEERARGLEMGAGARSMEGRNAQTAGYLKAAGTIFGSSPSLFDRYGKGGAGLTSSVGSSVRGSR